VPEVYSPQGGVTTLASWSGIQADPSSSAVLLPGPAQPLTFSAIPIPGFDDITLERLTLLRPVDPADTALVDQVCQAVDDLASQPGKLRGKRLAEAVDALNALGGTWQLEPAQPPVTG
jgi:hypothetical protein